VNFLIFRFSNIHSGILFCLKLPIGPTFNKCRSVLLIQGLDLRVEHSHGWSLNGKAEGGHYHYDLAPDTVEYHGFYALAQTLRRIDRPATTHGLGR